MRRLGCCLAAALLSGGTLAQGPPQTPAPPVFRGETTLVPIDVRVLDAKARPVTDLTEADFTVFENGARQRVTHFLTQALRPQSPDLLSEAVPGRGDRAAAIVPPTRRLFLLVLGRGRLQPPSKGVDGLLHFVRDRLLPQDRVAVLAWDRATEFTYDHTAVAELLERFKRQHEGIEARLKNRLAGLAAIYGGLEIPAEIRADIDKVFNGPRAPGQRTLIPPVAPNAARIEADSRRMIDLLQQPLSSDTVARAEADAIGIGLDEFVSINAQSMQDVGNLYTGVRYLQHLEGEKHLVFAAERTPLLPRAEDDKDLAAFASDARVVIHYLHTGGTMSAFAGRGISTGLDAAAGSGVAGSTAIRRPPMLVGGRLGLGGNFQLARTLAGHTGGLFYGNRNGTSATDLDLIDQATRFGYLLGYSPANTLQDGRYRRIDVRVNRPGLTVLYRHGYFARHEPAPLDRQRLLTYSRVVAAANFAAAVPDIGVKATASLPPSSASASEVTADVAIDLTRVHFTKTPDGRNRAAVELAVFCLRDGAQNLVGQWWRTLELTYTDARLDQVRREGFRHVVTLPVVAPPQTVKAVVYQFDADLVGSAVVNVSRR
jgi:VWFA-related protein